VDDQIWSIPVAVNVPILLILFLDDSIRRQDVERYLSLHEVGELALKPTLGLVEAPVLDQSQDAKDFID